MFNKPSNWLDSSRSKLEINYGDMRYILEWTILPEHLKMIDKIILKIIKICKSK